MAERHRDFQEARFCSETWLEGVAEGILTYSLIDVHLAELWMRQSLLRCICKLAMWKDTGDHVL